jgi:hypothetical protein
MKLREWIQERLFIVHFQNCYHPSLQNAEHECVGVLNFHFTIQFEWMGDPWALALKTKHKLQMLEAKVR